MRVCFTNLGCKLNQAELEGLARDFTRAGHRVVSSVETADLHVVNTCTVTHVAARTSRKAIRRGRRANPRLATVVTGCWASEAPAAAQSLEGVDLVVTNDRKEHLLALVHERFGAPEPANEVDGGPLPVPYVPLEFGNTRASVKIEDGCNVGCAFCIIPSTRGRQTSRPLPQVLAEVDALAQAGAREVVVTGVQISHYRWQGRTLCDLLEAILAETSVPRLRVTSIAPWAFDDRLLGLLAADRLCRHVHMSLQSGSTATLARMRRPYTAAQYGELVARLREAVPGLAVTTDVIVGFPGESEREFEESLAFVEQTAFAKVHAFPFSARPGTPAAGMPEPVPHGVKRERMERLLALGGALERRFAERQVGTELSVLFEERRDGAWWGTSDNYARVGVDSGDELGNTLRRVRVAALTPAGLRGEIVGQAVPAAALPPVPRFPVLPA